MGEHKLNGRPRICQTPEIMQERIDAYFDDDGIHTICGMALALGFCSRQSFLDYPRMDPVFTDVIAQAKCRVEAEYEAALRQPKISSHGPTFALMNMGWATKNAIEHSGTVALPGLQITPPEEPRDSH